MLLAIQSTRLDSTFPIPYVFAESVEHWQATPVVPTAEKLNAIAFVSAPMPYTLYKPCFDFDSSHLLYTLEACALTEKLMSYQEASRLAGWWDSNRTPCKSGHDPAHVDFECICTIVKELGYFESNAVFEDHACAFL